MRGSISNSSQRLLQSSSEGRSIYKVLVNGEFSAIKRLLFKRFSAGHDVTMKGFSDFLDIKKCENWDQEISS